MCDTFVECKVSHPEAAPKDSNGLLSFKHSWGADDRMYNYINYTNDLLKTILNAKRIFYNLVR